MGIFYFPSNFIYWRQVPNHEIFKEKILKYINENEKNLTSHNLINNGLTSYNPFDFKAQSFLMNYTEFINSVVWDSIKETIQTLDSRNDTISTQILSSKIFQCWYTVYDKNSSISFHNHNTQGRHIVLTPDNQEFYQTFTLLYIIKNNCEKNQTKFIQPSSHGVSAYLNQITILETSKIKDIGEGTVIVFPSNLNHEVISIPEDGRVIFSCDIISTFKNP